MSIVAGRHQFLTKGADVDVPPDEQILVESTTGVIGTSNGVWGYRTIGTTVVLVDSTDNTVAIEHLDVVISLFPHHLMAHLTRLWVRFVL